MRYIFLVIFVLLAGCSQQHKKNNAAKNEKNFPDQESFDSNIIVTADGHKSADIWAAHVLSYNRSNKVILKDSVHVDFFNKNGEHKSVLTAMEGIVNQNTKDLTAMGKVKVVSDDGVILLTERLNWKNFKQRIIADTAVVFITDLDTIYGDYFESDPDLNEYIIKNSRGVSRRDFELETF